MATWVFILASDFCCIFDALHSKKWTREVVHFT